MVLSLWKIIFYPSRREFESKPKCRGKYVSAFNDGNLLRSVCTDSTDWEPGSLGCSNDWTGCVFILHLYHISSELHRLDEWARTWSSGTALGLEFSFRKIYLYNELGCCWWMQEEHGTRIWVVFCFQSLPREEDQNQNRRKENEDLNWWSMRELTTVC